MQHNQGVKENEVNGRPPKNPYGDHETLYDYGAGTGKGAGAGTSSSARRRQEFRDAEDLDAKRNPGIKLGALDQDRHLSSAVRQEIAPVTSSKRADLTMKARRRDIN